MHFLLANSAFHHVGGSETYLLTAAENLLRLGHEVRIFAHTAGDMAQIATRHGISVVDQLADLGEPADVAITQDGAIAYEVASVWPQVPQLFVCHSSLFDYQQPPLVPEVATAVIALNDRVRRRLESLNTDLRIVRLTQPIDTQRFQPESAPASTPRRALILSNYLAAEARQVLVETWEAAGLEVVQTGTPTVTTMVPETSIADADIVVAKGRSALEAMSCGKPTYVFDMLGNDGWITPQSYAEIEADGITGSSGEPGIDVRRLRADLANYDPQIGRLGRELVLRNHDARQHAHSLVELAREVAAPNRPAQPSLESELGRQVRLRWLAEAELFTIRAKLAPLALRAEALETAYDAQLTHVANIEATASQLEAELALSRHDADNLRALRAQADEAVAELRATTSRQRRKIQDLQAAIDTDSAGKTPESRWRRRNVEDQPKRPLT